METNQGERMIARLLSRLFGPPPPPREPQPRPPRLRLREVPGELLERVLCWIARRTAATTRGCQAWRRAYRRELVESSLYPTPREMLDEYQEAE